MALNYDLGGNDLIVNTISTGATGPGQAGTNLNLGTTYKTNTATSSTTLTAANISGGVGNANLAMTGTLGGAANAQLPTVASLVALVPVGTVYRLRIINASSANFAWTVTTNTGWTLTGTMSIAQNTTRDFVITITSATAATIQNVGAGTL